MVENFKLGTLERLGLGYAQLRNTNPCLLYTSGAADDLVGC